MSSPVISNLSQFQLSPFGAQASGRQILADEQMQKLLQNFQANSQEQSSTGYHALAVISAVNSLRSSAVPVNSYVRNGSPSTRCISGPGFEIEYELNMGLSQTDITITDIRVVRQSLRKVTEPALWNVTSGSGKRGRWKVSHEPVYTMQPMTSDVGTVEKPLKVGINGFCSDIMEAASILPSHICRGSEIEESKLNKSGYQLFYTPQDKAIKAGWQFVKQLGRRASAESDVEAGRVLASYMKDAYEKGLHVEWTSHRGGSAVLTEAMRSLKSGSVNLNGTQSIFLSDHTSSHFEADLARRAIGMDVRDPKWFHSTPGLAQVVGGRKFGAATIACSLNKLVNHTPKDQMAGELVGSVVDITVQGKATIALGVAVASGFSSPLAIALLGTALASAPALTRGYHNNPAEPLKQLANKIQNKVS